MTEDFFTGVVFGALLAYGALTFRRAVNRIADSLAKRYRRR